MVRSAAGKVMWVGRATVFLVGLSVILALVFGVATSAFGANGNPFLLGKSNVATLLTKLTGNVNGSAMQVVNSNAGADDTALSLSVQAGEAPMRVNSATRVANLNADKLDGLDSAQVRPVGRSSWVGNCSADNGPAICTSTSITLPANARVLLNSTGSYFNFGGFTANGYYKGTCNFTRDGVDIPSTAQIVGEQQVATGAAPVHKIHTPGSQANTHVTEVLTAGTYAFGVRCTQNEGDVDWLNVSISAVTLGE